MQKETEVIAEKNILAYYKSISDNAKKQYKVASLAKQKGFDASQEIECPPTEDLADRTEKIIGPKGVAKRYREILEEKKDRTQAMFTIFKEILEEKWCTIPEPGKRVEQAIKTALVLNTDGVVVAPLDGVPEIKISSNPDGSKYIDIYYAGPIRAAGGTATVLPLILGDYAKKLLGLDRYKPTQDEIERYVEECRIYSEIITRQYTASEEEVKKIILGCSVCINGEPTEEREASINRNLPRIPSNRVRGGMCLVISEGVCMKASKILKLSKMLGLDWSWLEEIIKFEKAGTETKEIRASEKYLEGVAAGRPILSYPQQAGGFRLRYGRARNTGLMGKGMHPATMHVLNDFVAVSTQIKVERPGKAAGIFPVDSIEGPIVKLKNGDVVYVDSIEEALKLRHSIEKILFLGDLLVSIGDFRHSAHPLVPVGYCEEWHALELKKALEEKKSSEKEFWKMAEKPENVSFEQALKASLELDVPLHPKFVYYYNLISKEELVFLAEEMEKAKKNFDGKKNPGLRLDFSEKTKRILEKTGICHCIQGNEIVLGQAEASALLYTFGIAENKKTQVQIIAESKTNTEALSKISGIKIRDKAGTFIGTRMGRPEQSKPRKMTGNPHVLFPIGLYGGNTRSINKASLQYRKNSRIGDIKVEISNFKCTRCGNTVEQPYCRECNARTVYLNHEEKTINLKDALDTASHNLGFKLPEIVKGVKGLINDSKTPEPLEKGILRAKHDLHIFRDGTIRFEVINAPLTHFKPVEIAVSIEKLKEMGYEKDIFGKELENDEQVLELLPQDIIINDQAGEFFVRVAKFIDDLLERFYKQEKYFNIETKEELVGQLFLGLAPHTSAAVIGRLLGYTKARACFAHPYFHQAKRRNIDGDQDSLMLLMDALLNFSNTYLPSARGGRMDAPLVFTIIINPSEIDNECYELETCSSYPLELYEKSQEICSPDISGIERIEHRRGSKKQYSGFSFTHETSRFDAGPKSSRYVMLKTMEEKIKEQARIQNMIAAVNGKDALERVMVSHLMPDIVGNARAFSKQNFRCSNCNAKYRRIPLNGKCSCGKESLILTIAEGSVRKYLEIAKEMSKEFELSDYLKQRIELVEAEINSVFKTDKQEQKSLFEFV